MTSFTIRTFAAAIVLGLWGPPRAVAQVTGPTVPQSSGATRPYRAVFGGSTANPDVHHSFDVTASLLGGYEDNTVNGEEVDALSSPLLRSGAFTGFSTELSYSWQGRRIQIGANAGSSGRYYGNDGEFLSTGHFGSIGLAAQLGQRGLMVVNQSVSYAPSYLYSLTPGLDSGSLGTPVGVDDFPLGDESVYVYDTNASLSYSIGRRASIEALGSYRSSDFGDLALSNASSLRSYSAGGRFRQHLTRNASLRLGYVYREGQYGVISGNAATAVHDIDVGVDYRRALSLTRRTTVDFAAGSAIVTGSETGDPNPQQLQYRVVGEAGIQHEMGRTWRARLAFNRGVGFSEAFAEPVFADAATLSVTGFLSRRVDVSARGSFSVGDVGLAVGSPVQSSFRTWNATTRVRYALGAMWAVYGEYLYYSQNLGTAHVVLGGVPSVIDRQSLQVGLTMWVPLLRR